MHTEKKYVITVVGPTAVGKTALSVLLAKHFHTAVLSADSRQLYKELSIGTAKPSKEEQDGVPHYFVDHLSVSEPYNAGMYERQALEVLEVLFKKTNHVIVCGGTGLYVKALIEGMDELPEADEEIRSLLQKELQIKGLQRLCEELKQVDPASYAVIDLQNPVRVLRAIEVHRQTGIPFSAFRTGTKKDRPFEVIKIGLTMDRDKLNERIDLRMDQMLERGLEEEAKRVLPYRKMNALQTVGYSEVFGYMDGLYDREEMIRLLKRNSRRYAKRQMTWFNKDQVIQWFHPHQTEEIIQYIQQKTNQ